MESGVNRLLYFGQKQVDVVQIGVWQSVFLLVVSDDDLIAVL